MREADGNGNVASLGKLFKNGALVYFSSRTKTLTEAYLVLSLKRLSFS